VSGVWVRGFGAVTPAGVGIDALVRALADHGWNRVDHVERVGGPPLPVRACRDFQPRDHFPPLVARRLDRPARLLAVAAREALAAAGAELPWPRERIGISAGTWNAGGEAMYEVVRAVLTIAPEEAPPMLFPSTVANAAASQLGILEKLAGPNQTHTEKQVSGLRAIAEAGRLLARGRAEAVLACGVDEAHWTYVEAYDRLRALRWPGRMGTVPGEGAVALLLAATPGARPLGRIDGWGAASAPAPPHRYPDTAESVVAACRAALRRADLEAAGVDLVVSLANGVPELDRLEREALEAVLGTHRPAALAVSDRLGEGGCAASARALAALLAVCGRLPEAWPAPAHLATAGYLSLAGRRPRVALVPALATGGSALAIIVTAC
jgi:3-oxoacyl-[acyl-carrier-protein] synthase II